jgi:hypothetical protein
MTAKRSFWLGVIIGFIVMVLLGSLPVLGPIIGGFIAGLFGAIVISVILILGGSLLFGIPGFISALGVSFIIVIATLYYGLLGFVGGGIAGAVVK